MSESFRKYHDYIPTWGKWGPWPFELGVAGMLLWLAEAFQRTTALRARFASAAFPLFDWVEGHQVAFSLTLAFISCLIMTGFIARIALPWFSPYVRAIGLILAAILFALISYSFLSVFPWSMGGIAYLFISWRTATVGFVHLREVLPHGQQHI